jgi:hypothetical protein
MSELSRETDELLERGRVGESLAPHDRARLKRAVLAQVAGVSILATTSTAAAWTTVAAKVVGVVVILGSVGYGVAAVLPPRASASAPQRAADARHAPPSVAARAPAPAVDSHASPVEPAVVAPSVPSAPLVGVAPAPVENRSPARNAAPPTVRAPSSLEEEARLFREADDAMKAGDPSRALRLLDELTARFPGSALAPDGAAERVFALCMAGRQDEARGAAADFLRTEPMGPLAERVRASCGGLPR